MKVAFWAILVLTASAVYGQTPTQVESTGACSPNVVSNQGTVEFTCNAPIDKATADKIVSLLNQILKRKNGSDVTNHKLDEILDFLRNHEQSPYDTTVMYSLDGMKKRVVSEGGGNQQVTYGDPAGDIFKQMRELEKQGDWPGLLGVCQSAIKQIPAWATPYLLCSETNIHLHNLDVATEQLGRAKGIVHESPEYAPVIDALSRLLKQAHEPQQME